MRRLIAAPLLLAAIGCSSYTQAQLDLATQAARGLAMCKSNYNYATQSTQQLAVLRRQQLDDAFDADVKQRATAAGGLTADWTIEARKAYAAGLDALAKQQAAADRAASAAADNLQATQDALTKLQQLQMVQLQWSRLPRDILTDSTSTNGGNAK